MTEIIVTDPLEYVREKRVDDYGRINVGTKYSGRNVAVVVIDDETTVDEVSEPPEIEADAD